MKPISQCRPERACIKQGEPLGGGKGNGGEGGGVSTQPTWERSGRAMTQRRDFQVSEERVLRSKGRDFQAAKRGCQKGVRSMHFHVYIMLITDCI